MPANKGEHASQRRNDRERRRRRRHLTDHVLVFGENQAQPVDQPHLLYAYPPGVPLPPSIATFCFPGGALPPAAQGSPIFSCNVVSSASRRVHICCLAFREPPTRGGGALGGGGGGALKCLCELSASDEIFRQRSYLYGLYRLYLSDAAARAAQPVRAEAEAVPPPPVPDDGEGEGDGNGEEADGGCGRGGDERGGARNRRQARQLPTRTCLTAAGRASLPAAALRAAIARRMHARRTRAARAPHARRTRAARG